MTEPQRRSPREGKVAGVLGSRFLHLRPEVKGAQLYLRPLEAHVDGARDSKGQGQNIYLEADAGEAALESGSHVAGKPKPKRKVRQRHQQLKHRKDLFNCDSDEISSSSSSKTKLAELISDRRELALGKLAGGLCA